MNRNIKKVVYKILEQDKLAREDTWYLIQQTLIEMIPCNAGTGFGQVLQGMKVNGISFEAITRRKRDFFTKHPELIPEETEKARREEEQEYYLEYARR